MKPLPGIELLARKKRGEQALAATDDPRPALRVALLSTFNVSSLAPFLAERISTAGFRPFLHVAPFGQIQQEALDPASALHAFAPDAVILVLAEEDHLQTLRDPARRLAPEDSASFATGRGDETAGVLSALRRHAPSSALLVVPVPARRPANPHLLDAAGDERGAVVAALWREALARAAASSGAGLVDYDSAEAAHGREPCRTLSFWYAARMRLALPGLALLASLLSRHLLAPRTPPRKVLVLDCDNTLWGGVVGEDGLEGIQVGDEGIGLAFQDFQREALRLHGLGILLALCSKNNEADAWAVFDRHPGMVLRREHFAAARINWTDKAENLRSLAEELSLGLDSFVFLDDNPVERSRVAQSLPMVLAPELPADPAERPLFLLDGGWFDRATLTTEDRARNQAYQTRREREAERATAQNVGDFLASLEQKIRVAPVTDATLARAEQMCQKTNQFNLTTRRHTAVDLRRMLADPAWEVMTAQVKDRFEDAGIVGLAAWRVEGERAEIDTFLLSCRVLGRGVEDALLRLVAQRAHARGARALTGQYLPTGKNAQVADFFPKRGFSATGEGCYLLELSAPPAPGPVPGDWSPL